jgi:hypothetical protein
MASLRRVILLTYSGRLGKHPMDEPQTRSTARHTTSTSAAKPTQRIPLPSTAKREWSPAAVAGER